MSQSVPGLIFSGTAWRGHDPRWAHDPVSGRGAAITGGRFNRVGQPTLYLALSESTVIREVQAGFAGRWQPLTMCAYDVRDAVVADLRNQQIMLDLGLAVTAPACDWRLDVDEGREPESWRLADRLRAEGLDGILGPSYAVGASTHDLNLVLWTWNQASGAQVSVIDDHGRLPPAPGGR